MVTSITKLDAAPELVTEVMALLSAIEDAIIGYVYRNQRFAYRTVATNLRTLLLDNHSARSWRRETSLSMFELCFGAGNGIFLRSFLDESSRGSRSPVRTLLLYPDPTAIIWQASRDSDPVSLSNWQQELLLVDVKGKEWDVRKVLQWMGDKSGAHVLNDKDDPRADLIFGLAPPDASQRDLQQLLDNSYGREWEHFVIDAGMRLLSARTNRRGQLAPMLRHDVTIPAEPTGKPTRLAFNVEKRAKD